MKKISGLIFLALIILLGACQHGHCAAKTLRVLATTFPVYQFTSNICNTAKNVEVDLLIPASVGCPHDFALKPADLKKLEDADIIVINGAGLEEFLTKPLASLHKKPEIIDAGLNVPVLGEADGHSDHINPHIFASPANAALMVANIATKLSILDPEDLPIFNQQATTYVESLKRISNDLQEVGARAANRGIALEHDALAYLAHNAGLNIVATFENSASASKLASLRNQLVKEKPVLLAGDDQYPDRLLQTLSAETKIPFAKLNTGASGPANAPLDYYVSVMKTNLETLEKFFDKK